MVHRVFFGEPKAVQDDDLVVESRKVRVGVGAIPAKVPLVDKLPVFEPARRKPQNLVLSALADALPILQTGQHIVAVLSLYPDDPLPGFP